MHYREVPEKRPIHTFEQVSHARRFSFLAPAMLLLIGATVAALSPIGADLYCVRARGGAQCVVHQHYPSRTSVVQSTGGEFSTPGARPAAQANRLRLGGVRHDSGSSANVALVPSNPLVYDARFYRDSIDGPLRRGNWQRGASFFEGAREAFVAGDSAGYTVRDRPPAAPAQVVLSVGLALVAALVALASTLTRRRYRLRFDPNSDTAWVSSGTLLKLGPEHEVRLSAGAPLSVRTNNGVVELGAVAPGSPALFSSTHYLDRDAFDVLARCVEKARGPIKTVAAPVAPAYYAAGAIALSLAAATLVAAIGRHMASVPSDQGTLVITARTRCEYGGITLLPGGSMQMRVTAGAQSLRVPDERGRFVEIVANVSPDTTTSIECDGAAISRSNASTTSSLPSP